MCGIVGERLLKDMFRASILIQKAGQLTIPASAALDQLERTGARAIAEFLSECGLLGDAAQQAAEKLQTLRNRYAHASGSNPQEDAISAIKFLHCIVEGTVSVFKDFELRNGKLVQRANGD
jgi:hypothetical protein